MIKDKKQFPITSALSDKRRTNELLQNLVSEDIPDIKMEDVDEISVSINIKFKNGLTTTIPTKDISDLLKGFLLPEVQDYMDLQIKTDIQKQIRIKYGLNDAELELLFYILMIKEFFPNKRINQRNLFKYLRKFKKMLSINEFKYLNTGQKSKIKNYLPNLLTELIKKKVLIESIKDHYTDCKINIKEFENKNIVNNFIDGCVELLGFEKYNDKN